MLTRLIKTIGNYFKLGPKWVAVGLLPRDDIAEAAEAKGKLGPSRFVITKGTEAEASADYERMLQTCLIAELRENGVVVARHQKNTSLRYISHPDSD